MSRHPTRRELAMLVAGEASAEESGALLVHLETCEACLEAADDLWEGVPGVAGDIAAPPMGERETGEIEGRLLRRIHAAGLGSQLVWLATAGLLGVIAALLMPITGPRRTTDEPCEGSGDE